MNPKPEMAAIQEARRVMTWVIFECPLGGNPCDCPIHALRKQSFDERRRFMESLTDEECVELYERHKKCQSQKEQSQRTP